MIRVCLAALATLSSLQRAAGQSGFFAASEQTVLGGVENATVAVCHQACAQLQQAGQTDLLTHYPELPEGYRDRFYSSLQAEAPPACVVEPQSAEAVSTVIKTVRQHRCPFGIKSGGHHTAVGTSNLHNGLVIDLRLLKDITVSEDKQTASVGPGNKWTEVYKVLESQGVLIIGGRVGSVGVGGFTVGGGISFLSNRYGWAVDNIRNFEVILPNGTLANANPNSHPDIYFALRGGGSNFGIVTRFDFETIPQNKFWGGFKVYFFNDLPERAAALGLKNQFEWTLNSIAITAVGGLQRLACKLGYGTKMETVINAFMDFAANEDANAHVYLTFNWIEYLKAWLPTVTYLGNQPVKSPPVFERFDSIPHIHSTVRMAEMSELVKSIEDTCVHGLRNDWLSLTFKADRAIIEKFWEIILFEVDSIRLTIPDATISSNIQLITKNQIAQFSKNGGNVFGVKETDGPLFILSLSNTWKNAKDDEAMGALGRRIMSRTKQFGEETNIHHPFIYRNYCSADQDVFGGFSIENQERLKKIQEAYDPGLVYASLQPVKFGF